MGKTKAFTWVLTACLAAFSLNAGAQAARDDSAEVARLKAELRAIAQSNAQVQAHLEKFDTLDFVVFSNQQWMRMHESHAKDIKVVMPDGTVTIGLENHIKNLAWLFMFAPDTKIKEHPIRFGSGLYTAVTGYMEGTFTKPMMMPDGSSIPPTGKSYKLSMATIGIWKDGVMVEEQLYWDNQSFMKQLGLAR